MAKSKNPRGSRWSRPYEEVFSKLKSEGKVGEDGQRIVNRKHRKRGKNHHDIQTNPGEVSLKQSFYEKGEVSSTSMKSLRESIQLDAVQRLSAMRSDVENESLKGLSILDNLDKNVVAGPFASMAGYLDNNSDTNQVETMQLSAALRSDIEEASRSILSIGELKEREVSSTSAGSPSNFAMVSDSNEAETLRCPPVAMRSNVESEVSQRTLSASDNLENCEGQFVSITRSYRPPNSVDHTEMDRADTVQGADVDNVSSQLPITGGIGLREGEVAIQVKAEDEPPTLSFEDTTVQLAGTSSTPSDINQNQVEANSIETRDFGMQTTEAPPSNSSASEVQELKSMMQVMLSRFSQMSEATQANSTALIMLADEVRQSRARMDKIAEVVGVKREDVDSKVKRDGIKMEDVDCELR